MGVYQVRIGVAAVEVGARNTVLSGASKTKLLFENGNSVGTGDTVETVKENLEVGVGSKKLLDGVKVEDVLEHSDVIGSAINDLNLESTISLGTNGGNVNVGDRGELVGSQSLGGLEDLVRHGLGGGATVGQVVFDTEVCLGTWKR